MLESTTWDAYNNLLLGPDTDRLRKILIRTNLLEQALAVPGDIVECGVYKGTGLFTWGKLLKIYGTPRRVIGFDTFEGFATQETLKEQKVADELTEWANFEGVTLGELYSKAKDAGIEIELIQGRIQDTAREFAKSYPNQRIALLNLDLDFYAPTLAALKSLWPLVTPGGIVIFDEYGVLEFTESRAVDEFFAGTGIVLKTIPWAKSPTAFVRKPSL